jgi:hypothetical protein
MSPKRDFIALYTKEFHGRMIAVSTFLREFGSKSCSRTLS